MKRKDVDHICSFYDIPNDLFLVIIGLNEAKERFDSYYDCNDYYITLLSTIYNVSKRTRYLLLHEHILKVKSLTFLEDTHILLDMPDVLLQKFINLQVLIIDNSDCNMSDKGLSQLTNLICLHIPPRYEDITDECLKELTNLIELRIDNDNNHISNNGICRLTNLKELYLGFRHVISSKTIQSFTKLQTLTIRDQYDELYIGDHTVRHLTNLTDLSISGYCFTNDALLQLTNLTRLDLSETDYLTVKGLSHLTNLQALCIHSCEYITENGLSLYLPNVSCRVWD